MGEEGVGVGGGGCWMQKYIYINIYQVLVQPTRAALQLSSYSRFIILLFSISLFVQDKMSHNNGDVKVMKENSSFIDGKCFW